VPAAVSWLSNDPDWSEFPDTNDGTATDTAGHPSHSSASVRSTAVPPATVHVPD